MAQVEEETLPEIIDILRDKYPAPETALQYSTPFELLVATILSAQTTDVQVNKLTARLFQKYNSPADFAELEPDELAQKLNSVGLYRNKSKFLIKSSQMILDEFSGQVPPNFSDLLQLPGVGRKTASVVLASAFSKPAFPVDTHVFRVANRIGLADSDSVDEVEAQLKDLVPRNLWIDMHHWLIFHGREICKARKPHCEVCPLSSYCQYYQEG